MILKSYPKEIKIMSDFWNKSFECSNLTDFDFLKTPGVGLAKLV